MWKQVSCRRALLCARACKRMSVALMLTDVTQDRRVTGAGLGPSGSASVDGSRLSWALLSPVHERLGFGLSHPAGYKLMRCSPHTTSRPSPWISRQSVLSARRNFPIVKVLRWRRSPSRSLRAASGGGLRPSGLRPTLTVTAASASGLPSGRKHQPARPRANPNR